MKLHRCALEDKLGRPISAGLLALHHCDVRACYEPEHLYEGTHAQNNRDCVERNRWRASADRPRVPEAAKDAIRHRYIIDGATFEEVAAEFGIGSSSVQRIVPRSEHRHNGPKGQSWDVITAICRKYAAGGVTQAELAKEFVLGTGTISRIITLYSAGVV